MKKFVSGFTTNFDGVTFDYFYNGARNDMVTYTEGSITVTSTYQIQINTAKLMTLVTGLDQIHFGARYALKVSSLNVAMKAEHTTTVFNKYDASYVSDHLAKVVNTQIFFIEIGQVANSFSLKLVNGASASNFLGLNENNTADQLHVLTDINDRSSWTITFSSNNATITNVHLPTRTIRYKNTTLSFATFTTGQQAVSLYVVDESISDTNAALRLVSEINDGQGEGADGNCLPVYNLINGAYNQLSDTARMTFNFTEGEMYENAQLRKDYLQSWDQLNVPNPGSGPTRVKSRIMSLPLSYLGLLAK